MSSNQIYLVQNYSIDSAVEDPEKAALLIKYLETFYDLTQQYEHIKFQYDAAKLGLEKMCTQANEEIGFRSCKGEYSSVTFVPGTEGRTEEIKILNERKVLELLEELGIDKEEFYTTETKTIGKRKASIRYGTK